MKFGIVGTNFVVKTFMKAALENKDVEVAAVCSGHYENAQKFALEYDIPVVCHTYQEMVEKHLIEAVYIATPNAMHYEQAKYFLEHHIPVFLEKPMCSNTKETKKLIEIARNNQTYLHHGIMPLYMPNLKILKEQVEKLGPIHNAFFVFSKYSSRYDAYLRGENPTTFRRELSNGSIMDLGIYPLSLIVSLFGKPYEIEAKASILETGVDAAFQAILKYSNFSVLVMASKASNTNLTCEISGEKGLITIPHPSLLDKVTVSLNGQEVHFESTGSPFEYQLRDFIQTIEKNSYEPSIVPYEVSIALMQVLDEIRQVCGIRYPSDE